MEFNIKYIFCASTGESLIKINENGKMTALQDCTVTVKDGKMIALKKGEKLPLSGCK